jgi:hypothetical protein
LGGRGGRRQGPSRWLRRRTRIWGVAKPKTPDTEADRLSRDEEEAQIRRAPAELVAGSPRRARHIFVRPMCPRRIHIDLYICFLFLTQRGGGAVG